MKMLLKKIKINFHKKLMLSVVAKRTGRACRFDPMGVKDHGAVATPPTPTPPPPGVWFALHFLQTYFRTSLFLLLHRWVVLFYS